MNDQFLYDARPQMRRSFAGELYERLSSHVPARARIVQFLRNPEKVFVAALAAALVAGVAWQMLNTEARFVKDVNGIDIFQTNYRIIDHALCTPIDEVDDALSLPGPQREAQNVHEIIASLPYQVILPTYVPEGLILNEENFDYPSTWHDFFHVEWASGEDQGATMALFIRPTNVWAGQAVVAPGKWRDIEIDGEPGIVIKGDFAFPFNDYFECVENFVNGGSWRPSFWNDEAGIRVMWVYDGVAYELSSPPAFGGAHFFGRRDIPKLSEAELIRVAESMIP